jgi:sulfhydrogenase subunit beta (sulfur reductase)
MLFKTLAKKELPSLVEIVSRNSELIGPKQIGADKSGKPLYRFGTVGGAAEMALDYDTTLYSAKTFFLPFREDLSTYAFGERDWKQDIQYAETPQVLFGLHACDIHGLLKLDKVFAKDFFPSPYYLARRRNTFIVGIDHEPCEKGFCQSLGTDTVDRGFDLFLTDIGKSWFVAVGSDRGLAALEQLEAKPISDADRHEYRAVRRRIAAAFKTKVSLEGLPNLLDIEFESAVWKGWGQKCLSCGSCAMVCPTCYCYGVTERVSMDFTEGAKVKQLHSCNLVDFALVAGGHNFRPDRGSRLKYRYYHQHRGFVEQYDEPKCVGCNRCGRACLAGINPPDVIRDLQAEDRK